MTYKGLAIVFFIGMGFGCVAQTYANKAVAAYKAHVVEEALAQMPQAETLSLSDRQTLNLVRDTQAKMAQMQLPRGADKERLAMLIEGVK